MQTYPSRKSIAKESGAFAEWRVLVLLEVRFLDMIVRFAEVHAILNIEIVRHLHLGRVL